MRLPIALVALVLAAPVCAQLWKPVDDATSAVGKPTPERVPTFTDPPKPTPETPKKTNTPPVKVMTYEEYQEYRRQNPAPSFPRVHQVSPPPVSAKQTPRNEVLNSDRADEINDKIRKKCEREWDGNYRMQVHCMKGHRAAIPFLEEFAEEAKLEMHKRKIYQHCSGNWLSEDNYRMMKYCVENQMKAYQTLNQ